MLLEITKLLDVKFTYQYCSFLEADIEHKINFTLTIIMHQVSLSTLMQILTKKENIA